MIIDASALLAIVLNEPDGSHFARSIATAERRRMPAVNWFEASLAVETRGDAIAASRFDDVVRDLDIEIVPFTAQHAERARQARRLYGRGTQHPAQLNFGDCMAYGAAKADGEPLLFKGNDFPHTDIEPARHG